MAGLDPAIYVLPHNEDVDARGKPGHDVRARDHAPPTTAFCRSLPRPPGSRARRGRSARERQ
nr:hypothetical protein CIT39_24235 [Bradyrhizobium symbiodeficiens]